MSTTYSDATAYPYPVLSRLHEIGGKPNRQSILRTLQELTANAASVDSVYGLHGHVFLTMTPTTYQALNDGTAFVPPLVPDPNPAIVAGSAAVVAESVRQHSVDTKAYTLMRHVQNTLRKMLLDSGDEIYWRRMRQHTILYSGRTVRELLDHMESTYGSFTEAERREVTARLDVPWEGGPLETVIQQIEEASDAFGSTGGALTEVQQRDKLYDLVQASNLMPEACQRWRMRPEVDKTWTDACKHFQQYANDRDEVQTSSGAGFHANHVEIALAANADALASLHDQMANLGVANTNQAATILDLTTRLAASTANHRAYRDGVNRTGYIPRSNNNRASNNNRGGGSDQRNQRSGATSGIRGPMYCWTHGSCAHHSSECENRNDGHQTTATMSNRMSGSNLRCP